MAQVEKAQRMLHEVRHLEYQSAAVRGATLRLPVSTERSSDSFEQ